MPDDPVASLLRLARDWLGAKPVSQAIPRDAVLARIDAALTPERIERFAKERFPADWDRTVERLRQEKRSLAEIVGREAAEAAIRAVGEIDPDERTIRAFFGERAVEKLLASLIYDGIVEFLKKGLNPVGTRVGGIFGGLGGAAGGFANRLAGLAGGAAGLLGEQLEKQVKAFLEVFAKVAVDRAVAYVTDPANRASFREMRERLVRRGLETPVRDHVARAPAERLEKMKARARDALLGLARDDAARRRVRERVERLFERHGAKTLRALGEELGAPAEPREPAPELVRLVAAFLEQEPVVAWFRTRYPGFRPEDSEVQP